MARYELIYLAIDQAVRLAHNEDMRRVVLKDQSDGQMVGAARSTATGQS